MSPLAEFLAAPPPRSVHHWRAVRFAQDNAEVTLATNIPEAYDHAWSMLYAYQRTRAEATPWRVLVPLRPDLDPRSMDAEFAKTPILDIGPGLHARIQPVAEGAAYWIPDLGCLIHTKPRIGIITAYCLTAEGAKYCAVRLTRQSMTAQMLTAGAVYTHAAALTLHGNGILIAGHKGCGKTTTLLSVLRRLGGDYVTNDRLLLRLDELGIMGYPWPTHLNVGIGTLLAFPELSDRVPRAADHLPSAECWTRPEKVKIPPSDFPQLLITGAVASDIRPRLMIWPELSPAHHGAHTEQIPVGEVKQILTDTRLFMHDPDRGVSSRINHWLFSTPPAARLDAHLHQVAHALADVPCYRLRTGGDPDAIAQAIAGLLQSGDQHPEQT